MHYSMSSIQAICGAELHLQGNDVELDTIGFDSRRLGNVRTTLFFCLNGKTQNGEKFVADAYQKGVRNFVTSPGFDIQKFPDANFLLAENPLVELQKLAENHRKNFTGPLIGITGSNGKTIVKEWLFSLLKNDFIIARSPRSYNSSLGVAISLLGIEKLHSMAIIEAGISMPGDMDVLQKMIQPNLGIITHLGAAHDENFENRKAKAIEKVKLFKQCDVVVYPYDAIEVREEISVLRSQNPLLKAISWGYNEGAQFRISEVDRQFKKSIIQFIHRGSAHQITIPFTDAAAIENAMTCLCTLAALERWDADHLTLFESLPVLENRLAFFEGKSGNYIVNDSYSNDLDSLQVALDFMLRQQPGMPHMAILSDLEQSDPDKEKLYKKVAELLIKKGTKKLIAIGSEIAKNSDVFKDLEVQYFNSTAVLVQSGILDTITGKSILIKGARSFKLEQVAALLRKQMHQTVLQIDLNALRNNYTYFRKQLQPGTRLMAMVKAFGYGSGSFEAARTLQFMGVDYLAVAYTDEGVALRKAGITVPVMVMNCTAEDSPALLEYNLEPVLFNTEGIKAFAETGQQLNVHIEIDTGMHRLGFDPAKTETEFANFPANLHIVSVFSHLSASESAEHDTFTQQQLSTFLFVCTNIEKTTGKTFIKHIANTGGILRFPEAHLDMVRLGIGLYGTDPRGTPNADLETVTSLKTNISQIRKIGAGESVGYSRKAIEQQDRMIATLPIGYADGLWRRLGNGNGGAWINGKIAPYVGNICMDMCMCDVTNIQCAEGDEVEIFGKHLSVEKLAQDCETIPYEILTAISQRVRREYVGEN